MDEADSAPKIILDVVYSNAKQIDSEQQVMTKLSGDVYVQSQLKQINNNFTKKLDDMNAKMDVIQLAVQHLSNAVVVIHEKLESMENYVPASKHYSLQPSTMSSDSRVMNCNPSSERKPFNQHAPKMNTYVDTMGSANSTGEDIQAEGEVHSLSHTYEYVQISDRSTSMSTSQNTSIVKQNEHQYENSQPVKPFNKADYVEVKVLAHGQSGEFWLAVNRFNGWKVVTKKPKATISQELLGNEIHLLSLCQHPNVIRFISADLNQSEQTYSLFFEYAELGQLKCFLQNNKDNMNNGKLLAMALGVASGMIELGLKRIIYCDLQSSNILVDGDMVCKIASFNKAQYLKENETYKVCHSFQIATRWQAPEVFNSRKFSVHSDVWSFGVFLAELFFYGETPYPGMTTAEVKNFVLGKKKMEMPKECPKGVYSLMKECFRYRAEQRMTFTALHKALKTQHSIFSKKPSDGSSSEFED
ncbi:proto-oncogene tyrosine-protein kinase LCK-like isoform X2 [Dysidea avara]|uniref:proto-oncogene tyrosine-protein kinase LCK-like isoform X2 n=1 Tax=Dysidea avara TaxID=196820 RepID=UPI003333621B